MRGQWFHAMKPWRQNTLLGRAACTMFWWTMLTSALTLVIPDFAPVSIVNTIILVPMAIALEFRSWRTRRRAERVHAVQTERLRLAHAVACGALDEDDLTPEQQEDLRIEYARYRLNNWDHS